jgi:nucleotide-binding universal stress UspA family protein
MWQSSGPVVVGIDGSDAAINAALWAVDEAVDRDVALRLVHVTQSDQKARIADEYRLEIQSAESALRAASAAVQATGSHVKIDTEILYGPADITLIDESADASMIVLGSTGIGSLAREFLGSTVVSVAANAYSSVAVIRTTRQHSDGTHGSIAVVVEDRADNEAVIEHAMEEARLRRAPVLAVGVWREDLGGEPYDELDRRIACWKRRFDDVDIRPVATAASIGRFLGEDEHEAVQLAVVGRADASSVAEIIGPHGPALTAHAKCSVLIVR